MDTAEVKTDTKQLTNEDIKAERDGEQKDKLTVIDYKMVTFSLSGKDYGIDIMQVKEIAKAGHFTYVPNTLPFVRGVYNLRGEIIPIVDLRLFFNIDVPEHKEDVLENMLIVSVNEQTFGLVVDEIDKVVGIQKSTIQPPHPLFGDISIKYIYGVVESNNRLYILLDIDRIFSSKVILEKKEASANKQLVVKTGEKFNIPDETKKTQDAQPGTGKAVQEEKKQIQKTDEDYRFIVEGLQNMKKFYVTDLNERWVKNHFDEWVSERGKEKAQFQNENDAEEFLKPFWSQNTGKFWTSAFADAVYKLLPDNSAKQIVVWNPGCGKGYETYSLACILKKRYPSSKIRIYAHEIDLLSVSNAPLMTVPADAANDWYLPYVNKKANGEYTFTQDIKDSIMFEYHDCTNTTALPIVDIVFARDILSLVPKEAQQAIISDFEEKLKGNGIIILGENESLAGYTNWGEHMNGSLVVYSKQ